jgi:hypothetical protein
VLVSSAAALARVRRVVPTGTFSAFSSVTARREATLAWKGGQHMFDGDSDTRSEGLERRSEVR